MSRVRQFLVFSLGLMIVFLVAATSVYVIREGVLRMEPIELVLDPGGSDETMMFRKIQDSLKAQLRPFENRWIWDASLEEILKTVDMDPRVQMTHVVRHFPNKLQIVIRPKQTSTNLLDQDGFLHPIAMDGSLLPPLLATQAPDRPALRGRQFFNNPSLRLKAVRLLEDLPERGLLSKAAISEIHYDEKTGFDLILISAGIVVRVGEESLGEKAQHIEQVLMYLQNQRVKGRVIDARFAKKVVVKLRKQP